MEVSRNWTVLVYTGACPDLAPAIRGSLEELSDAAVRQEDVAVVGQMGGPETNERFDLHKGMQPIGEGRGEMSDPSTLQDFLAWGMRRYPAKHYAIVVGGHGTGLGGAVTNWPRRKMMSLPDLAATLKDANPDLVVFNACLMAQAEVLCQLGKPMVATQTQELGLGLPLGEWIEKLPGASDPGQALVDACRGKEDRVRLVSSLQPNPELTENVDRLARTILENPQHHGRVGEILARQPAVWVRKWEKPLADQIDLKKLAGDLTGIGGPIGEAAEALKKQIGSEISIYAPEDGGDPRTREIYAGLRFAQLTAWDEMLSAVAAHQSPGE